MRPVLVFLKSEKTFDNFMLFHPHKTVKRNENFQVGHGWYPAFLLLKCI